MNIRFDTLAGDESQFPLEHRILNIILIFSATTCFLGSIIHLFLNLGAILVSVTLVEGILFAFLYYLSIVKRQYKISIYIGLIVFMFVVTPAAWMSNAGSMGSFPYFLIVFSSIIVILFSGFKRIAFIFILTTMTIVLIILESRYPFLVKAYQTDIKRYIDISLTLIIIIIFNALIFVVVLNNYKKEHKKVKAYLRKLKTTNGQLQREIAERKQAEEALRESEDKYRTIFQTTGTAVIIIEEDTTISLANEEFEKLSGYSKWDIEGKISWKQFIPPENVERMVEYHNKRRHAPGSAPSNYETHFVDRLGNKKDVLTSVSIIPGTQKSVASLMDISAIKQAEEQLKYLATHDYLTGIPNRYSFEESLKKAVAKAKRGKESALLFVDIDNFKMVNDTKGHAAGDDLLINIANIIKENLRESDTLARLGGDEFGILLEETTVEESDLVAEKLRQKTEANEFCLLKYGCFNLSLSIGVVMIDGTLNSQKLLSLADTALYAAKEKGRNRVVFLDPDEEITTRFSEINQLITLVKNAVKEDRFVLYFQPVVRVENGKIVHHEALVRLKGKHGELISPQAFIPAAERFGLMPQIDRWVVGASLDALRQHPGLNLFINISGISLSEESLLEYIEEMITQCGMEPSRIGFEITETAAVKDMMLARRWIERLKKLGCRFALDDFGIGFSSFSYLRILPVDYLKIDGSFIRNLEKDPSNRALVEAMSTIARSLGIKTVAEYVENGNVLKILQELKIDCAQGYFLGMPDPII